MRERERESANAVGLMVGREVYVIVCFNAVRVF